MVKVICKKDNKTCNHCIKKCEFKRIVKVSDNKWKKVYIAGKINGLDNYRKLFKEAEDNFIYDKPFIEEEYWIEEGENDD